MTKHFRPCAVAVVFNADGKVLLGNRIDTSEAAWQFPQGGIEAGETPTQAAKRELFEETSIVSVQAIYTDAIPQRYEFPSLIKDKFAQRGIFTDGQEVYFSLFYFVGKETEINLQTEIPEFSKYCWESFDFAVEHIVSFKKDVYSSAANRLQPIIRQYLDTIS